MMQKNGQNNMSDDKSIRVKVIEVTRWAPTLLSFKVTRPDGFKFTAGQFVRLGLNPTELQHFNQDQSTLASSVLDERIFRAYSVASSPFDEFLEFFSVVIVDGAFTSRLQYLQVGDRLWLNPMPFGYLTLARYQQPAPKDLWLLATGTGLAPFLSLTRDPEVYERFDKVILVHGVRYVSELGYRERFERELFNDEYLADYVKDKFIYYPTVTREPFRNEGRMTNLMRSGKLFEDIGLPPMNPTDDRAMICGSPSMNKDVAALLDEYGLKCSPRMGGTGDYVVERAFVEQ